MRKLAYLGAAAAIALTSPAFAQNLVQNGSFEAFTSTARPSGSGTYNQATNWTLTANVGSDAGTYPPSVITYNTTLDYPNGAFNESVAPPTSASNSPDPVGTHGLYFVSDTASPQTLTQSITITTAGTYQLGFDYYATINGFSNEFNASLQFSSNGNNIGGALTTGDATQNTSPGVWRSFNTTATLNAGVYNLGLNYRAGGVRAADFVVDRVYVQAAVPEPTTWAMMGLGFAAVGFAARRRSKVAGRTVTA